MSINTQSSYNEVDFLLPAQKFNIGFSFVSQKGLPFYREFVLRLIHLAPISKFHIATYFGFSKIECDEAVSDLVERGELTISADGRLMLTEKSKDYFTDLGESPRLAAVQDSSAILFFELATFSCLGKNHESSKWKAGISLKVNAKNSSQSESMVEKNFQRQFNDIFEKGYLPDFLSQNEKEPPNIYTVNSVNRLRQLPLRLTTDFKLDSAGLAVEREDFDQFKNSEVIHELMTNELACIARENNLVDSLKSMMEIGDDSTPRLFGSGFGAIKTQYLEELNKFEEYSGSKRKTFLGQIYSKDNWALFQEYLSPVLSSRLKANADLEAGRLIWVAPSDPFWAKSLRFTACLSETFRRASTKDKKEKQGKVLYTPSIFIPLASSSDTGAARRWVNQLDPFSKFARGIAEGFLGGNVEVLYLENTFVTVVYHISQPELLPVSMPVGFISNDPVTVREIGKLIEEYINGSQYFGTSNDYGLLVDF